MGAPPARSDRKAGAAEASALRAEIVRLEALNTALRENERMYRCTAEIAERLVWAANPDGEIVAMSPIFETLTGIPMAEALQGGWLAAIHPDDREPFLARWTRSLKSGEPFCAEFRALRADGSARLTLARGMAIRDQDGGIERWCGLTEDVEDERAAERARRNAEASLRDSEELHRFTLELMRQIVWSVEPDGSGLTLSPRYYKVTGMEPADEPSLSIHPDDRDRVQADWEAARVSERNFETECRLAMRNGGYRVFRVRAAPQRDADGRIIRWYGVSEDIQEERVAEEAHRNAEERYRLAVMATNVAVWDYDVASDTLDWSDNSAAIFGSPENPIGRTSLQWWHNRIHPEDRDRTYSSFCAAIAGPQTHWSAGYRFLRGDGGYADILDRGFITRDTAGAAVRAVGAMADVTDANQSAAEYRRMQTELIHVSRLSAMGAMASTLAHELNQPLAAISNFISGGRRLLINSPESMPQLEMALKAAASGAQRAGEIVRRLRELVSRGTVAVMVEDLPQLIEEASVVAFVDEAALGVHHRLELDPAARWVRGDRIQIQQVLINLVRNAIEAMETSREREIVIATRAEDGMVEVSVADTGTGIAPEHFETLFSRFMTTKSGGMGIGLPISRTIVELHGGKIWAQNRPEGGAIFRFTLPGAAPAKPKANHVNRHP
ncbi:MAG: PAS domain-containing sensor histidine kinase [Allosphingosinicella sp.]